MLNNKSPRLNTVEFYKDFLPLLSKLFTNMVNKIFQIIKIARHMKTSLITLIIAQFYYWNSLDKQNREQKTNL